jgi:transposase
MTSIATRQAAVSTASGRAVTGPVTGGVDTHGQTHHAAVIDALGRPVGDREFASTPAGYRALTAWLHSQRCVGDAGGGGPP